MVKKDAKHRQSNQPETEGTKKSINWNKYLVPIYLIILAITFFKTYSAIFDKKIDLGGDNAGYYILGNALASGEGYTNIDSSDKKPHNHFPPGYPIIIAASSKIGSSDIIFQKKVNGFFLIASLMVLFFLFSKFTGNIHISFIATLFTLINSNILHYSTIMMSEISFMFFLFAGLLLFIKMDTDKPFYKSILLGVLLLCAAFAYHIKTTGIALVLAILFALLLKKKWKYIIAFASGFILLALPWFLRNKSLGGNSYMHQLMMKNPYRPELGSMGFSDFFERFFTNLQRYITREIPTSTFSFITVNYKDPLHLSDWFLGIAIALIIVFGLIKLKRFHAVVAAFLAGSMGILLLWPDVWYGVRFILPLIPLLVFLFINGSYQLLKLLLVSLKLKETGVVKMGLPMLALLAIPLYQIPIQKLKKDAKTRYPSNYENYFEIARWVGQNTPQDAVISCRKTGLFYVFSHHPVTNYKNTLDKEELIEDFIEKGVDYVVLEQLGYASTGRYLYPAIQRYPEKFRPVKHLTNPDTYLLKFEPKMGYWGEWENDQKNGEGTFVYDNGDKYEGHWKNNEKDGKGTIYYSNGQKLDGTWIKDKLQGEAVLWDKDGMKIKKSLYINDVETRQFK